MPYWGKAEKSENLRYPPKNQAQKNSRPESLEFSYIIYAVVGLMGLFTRL